MVSPCANVLLPGAVITGAAFGGAAAVTVIVNVAVTAVFTPSCASMVTVYGCAAALDDTVPCTWPLAYASPDGSPLTVTVTVSPSASDTVIANGEMVSPCANVLLPGAVITGAALVCACELTEQNATATTARAGAAARAVQARGRRTRQARRTPAGRFRDGTDVARHGAHCVRPPEGKRGEVAGWALRPRTVSFGNVGSLRLPLRRVTSHGPQRQRAPSEQRPIHFRAGRYN